MKFSFFLLIPLGCLAAIPNDVAPVIDMARHVPAEFCADALIRVASTDKVDKATRVQLLDEAFRCAAGAQRPFKRQPSITKVAGTAGILKHVYQQDLDTLSLRLRAVEAMLALDPVKARSLFLEIPPLQIPKVTCDDYLVYDVRLFYDVLGKLARQSFTAKEVADGAPTRLLATFLGGIHSASQVEPAARMLAQTGSKNADFQTLVTAFGGALSQIYGDDRSFTDSISAVGEAMLALADDAAKRKLPPGGLIEGYRRYLVNNLAGQRCADDALMDAGQTFELSASSSADALGTDAARLFNEKLARPPVLPLREEEVTPAKIEGAASGLRSCQDAECKQLTSEFRSLIFSAEGAPLSSAQRDSAEWRSRLQQFLASMADWKESTGTADAEQFREKCALFNGLVGVAPAGPDRERVFLAWLDYLEGNRVQQDDRIGWFLPVNALIGRVALDPLGLGKLTDALRKSRDPVIALYIELERVAPRSPVQILALM